MVWGRTHGVKIIDLGGSHAWYADGPFINKRRWGAQVARRKRIYGVWMFLAQKLSSALRAHLNQLGLISEINRKFYRVWLAADSSECGENDGRQALSPDVHEGVDGVVEIAANTAPIIMKACR
jgi:hypothetical protein